MVKGSLKEKMVFIWGDQKQRGGTSYFGEEPTFTEGDVFRIIVPVNDAYSFDFGQNGQSNHSNQTDHSNQPGMSGEEKALLDFICQNPDMTNALIAEHMGWSVSKVKYYVQKLKKTNKIKRIGTSRKGYWEILISIYKKFVY